MVFLFWNASLVAQFTDVTDEVLGIDNINENTLYGNGLSFFDFNNDGWDDLSLANGSESPIFLINNNGIYEDAGIVLPFTPLAHVIMILWADIENDGDYDLFITEYQGAVHLLLNEGDFNFTDITASAGIEQGNWNFRGAAFCDYDHDGFLDLYLAKYYIILYNTNPDHTSILYRNNGDLTFSDVTISSGIYLDPAPVFQPVFLDYDHDGWEDVYLVIDRNFWENELYHNNGDGTFTNVSEASGTNASIDAMSGTVGDFDNDADLDIYISNGQPGNRLYQNNGDGTFTNIAAAAGVTVNVISWGAQFIDYDNNGWQDLFVSTTDAAIGPAQNRFYRNNTNSTFSSAESLTGILGDNSPGFTVALGDINNDGYYDFVTNNNDPYRSRLWQSIGGENTYLSVVPHGTVSNAMGIGVWMNCYAGGHHYVRQVRCGDAFQTQSSSKEIFGLDTLSVVDSLVIEWPSGIVDHLFNIAVNQLLHVYEGSTAFQSLSPITESMFVCPGDSLLLISPYDDFVSWNDGRTSDSIWVHSPGDYYILVEDGIGQLRQSEVLHIASENIANIHTITSHVTCPGGADASIHVLSTVELSEMNWAFGASGFDLDSLTAGAYEYEAWTVSGCYYNGTAVVNEPPLPEITAEVSPVLCYGESSGSVDFILPQDGNTWTESSDNPATDGLTAGSYTYSFTNENGCTTALTVEVIQPLQLQVDFEIVHPLCAGTGDGQVTYSVSGGSGEIVLLEGDENLSGLAAGIYSFTFMDEHGCTLSADAEIIDPSPLFISAEAVDLTCAGASDGYVNLNFSGGSGGLFLSPDSSPQSDLPAGNYSYTVLDLHGCEASISIAIDEPAPILANIQSHAYYSPANPGVVVVEMSGGYPPYSADCTDEDFLAFELGSLVPGNYSCIVSDQMACNLEITWSIADSSVAAVNEVLPLSSFVRISGGSQLNILTGVQQVAVYSGDGKLIALLSRGDSFRPNDGFYVLDILAEDQVRRRFPLILVQDQ